MELDDLNDGNIKLELDIKDEIIDLNQDKLEITLDWIELNNNFDCNGR